MTEKLEGSWAGLSPCPARTHGYTAMGQNDTSMDWLTFLTAIMTLRMSSLYVQVVSWRPRVCQFILSYMWNAMYTKHASNNCHCRPSQAVCVVLFWLCVCTLKYQYLPKPGLNCRFQTYPAVNLRSLWHIWGFCGQKGSSFELKFHSVFPKVFNWAATVSWSSHPCQAASTDIFEHQYQWKITHLLLNRQMHKGFFKFINACLGEEKLSLKSPYSAGIWVHVRPLACFLDIPTRNEARIMTVAKSGWS